MLVSVTKDGGKRIIRFPELLGEGCDIPGEMDLFVLGRSIIMRPCSGELRSGWSEKYKIMHHRGEDAPLFHD